MTIEQLYTIFQQYPSVQTDTRALKEGDLFFALKGPNFNANQFAEKALAAGAPYAVVDEAPAVPNDRIIVVKDTLDTLQQLAKHHRRQFNIPVIAITGSNGKTTTKELVHAVLSTTYKTYTTQDNLNNHIGVPLTILRIQKDAEMAVIEMGANHQQEIASYCAYTLPTHGIITNAGKAHLEGFGGEEGVRKGKGELYDYLRTHEGTAFVMWDYHYLQTMSKGIPTIIKYGTIEADVTGQLFQSEPFLSVAIHATNPFTIQTQLVGAYNLPNVLVAVTIGKQFNIEDNLIKRPLKIIPLPTVAHN
ncbi:UDP-N-acetylmuramoyl-tripeptide--D-alanyl-D-alanine ligase [Paraflavitalea speifideaquila]|uniref:UDP-N-acetylmuramoyl-tripeptide--D-alanyl-D- alanine ligase n=1 Tax=Paraflavitalea speifideaquila TaxID=3076558 RepID=UPI0028EA8BA5|nr:Mur ligase family protein [Paraflavitalea speifideiaquila]